MPTAVLGDIHGDFDRMLQLVGGLEAEVHLVTVGDYFDRWPQGMEVVRWLMARPNTTSLLGNHDALIMATVDELSVRGEGGRAMENWIYNGGQEEDLERLRDDPEAMSWLRSLPAMARVGGTLVQHCDAPVYLNYGRTVDEVNRAVEARLLSRDPDALFQVFAALCRRRQFYDPNMLRDYVAAYGAKRLVHGHTPHKQPTAVSLFRGMITNVDGALSRGIGPGERGFVHWLPED